MQPPVVDVGDPPDALEALNEPPAPKQLPGRPKYTPEEKTRHQATWRWGAWKHRCFWLQARRVEDSQTVGWLATNVFPMLASDLPSRFFWTADTDRQEIRNYIDALLCRRKVEAANIESTGVVCDIEFPVRPRDDVSIKVDMTRLIDFFTMRDHFEVPLWGRVHFFTDGARLVPREFIGALGGMVDRRHKRFFNEGREWRYCTEKDLAEMGLKTSDVTSSMYREDYEVAEEATGEDSPDVAPREDVIVRDRFEKHFEVLTVVRPSRAQPYYTRRLITYQGEMVWVGTSFSFAGPWTVFKRDTGRLVALGISID